MVALSVWLRSNEISRRLEAQKSACAFRFAQENLFIFWGERKKRRNDRLEIFLRRKLAYLFTNRRASAREGEGDEFDAFIAERRQNFPLHFESSRVQYLRVEKKMYRSIFRHQINNERIYRKSWTLLLFRFDMNGGY